MKNKSDKIQLPKAILIIFVSVCILSGTCLLGIVAYKHIREKQRLDNSYHIVAVVQTSPDAEGLKTAYLAEVLGLSVDKPVNLHEFNAKEAQQTLLKVPVIKEAKVRKIHPGTIHIDYVRRKPIAYFRDYTNTAIDADGILFPFKPFFTPKRLPEIVTGQHLEGNIWGKKVENKWLKLAYTFLNLSSMYCDDKTVLCCIDVSQAYAGNNGQRQVVLSLEDRVVRVANGQSILCIHPRILRLCPDNFHEQLANYISLRTYLRDKEKAASLTGKEGIVQSKPTIIDMRLSDLAFFNAEF